MKKYYKYELNIMSANILSLVMLIIPIVILFIFKVDVIGCTALTTILFTMIVYFIFHELLHGIGFSIFAKDMKNIKFGITLEKGVLYALCQEKIGKTGILISLLLPLVILSFIVFPIGLLLDIPLLIFLSIVNFAGAIGDILMTFLIALAPKDVEYIDYTSDIGAYLVSESDMTNYKTFGFSLAEKGLAEDKLIDNSIKRLYVSKTSAIILIVFIVIFLISFLK